MEVVPLVLLVESYSVHFSPVMRKDHLEWDEIFFLVNGLIVTDSQRISSDGLERAPHIDDLDTPAKETLEFILVLDLALDAMSGASGREVAMDAVRGRLVVDMLPLVTREATDAVSEDDSSGSASAALNVRCIHVPQFNSSNICSFHSFME